MSDTTSLFLPLPTSSPSIIQAETYISLRYRAKSVAKVQRLQCSNSARPSHSTLSSQPSTVYAASSPQSTSLTGLCIG
ncbi:hypothetical protein FIBSPDRAFT_251148 [Athelia psychrophila]|uniref:Uncharacterized protein n=1 Tax=Athelia psychrophila TaxID=1759441 RepID=A0A165XVH6_9AGAM|nr:hypothetical protein FIBSPDRAFT_250878 [Fibularhizoctonia sp. CBS 109695]KZP08940.1 hypothetical protein FIBSPDRAFT_251148 [Fibularhizoctonia sp. CBS 109695]